MRHADACRVDARGIPFAAPPVGDLRWRAPQPAPKWNGVRSASEYGRACMQSNPAISNPGENMQSLEVAEQDGAAWAKSVGAASLRELRAMPAETLLTGAQRQRGLSWPVTDGWVIPDDQFRLYQAGRYNDVPVLIGYNSDEGASFGAPPSQDAYVQSVRERYGQFADKLLAAYPGGETPAAKKTARDLTRDTAFGWHTWSWARLQKETGKTAVFLYYFDEHPGYPADSPRAGFGTPHSEELPYVFRQLREHRRPAPTPADEAMSDMMRTYWTNFARTGDPNGAGLPRWPSFANATPQMLHIASGRTQAGPIVNEEGLEALDEYFAWRRASTVSVRDAGR